MTILQSLFRAAFPRLAAMDDLAASIGDAPAPARDVASMKAALSDSGPLPFDYTMASCTVLVGMVHGRTILLHLDGMEDDNAAIVEATRRVGGHPSFRVLDIATGAADIRALLWRHFGDDARKVAKKIGLDPATLYPAMH